jgi:hypothetical protein
MTALTTRTRLIEQYQRATSESGRYERADRGRFLRHLISGISSHHAYALSRETPGRLPEWQDAFLRESAARQGREAATTCAFIVKELAARVGNQELRDDLLRDQSPLGIAISRRMAAPAATSSLRLAALRVRTDDGTSDVPLSAMPADGGECARYDVVSAGLRGANSNWSAPSAAHDARECDGLRVLSVAVAVDNPTNRTAHAAGIELRVQCQTATSGCFIATPVSAFGCAQKIDPKRRAWIAFRGLDLLAAARAFLPPGERIDAVRLLVTRL